MRVAIDAVGRMVIPKPLRDALGIRGATELELTTTGGRLEVSVPDVPARVEDRGGFPVIVTDDVPPPLDVDGVREVVERTRR